MCEATDSSKKQEGDGGIMPKVEVFDCDLPTEDTYSRHIGDNMASSSSSNVRSSLIGMGFTPSLVDRAIEENGDSNIEVLLEALFSYPADQKPKSEASSDDLVCYSRDGLAAPTHALEPLRRSNSSDSLNSWVDDNIGGGNPSIDGRDAHIKEDPDVDADIDADIDAGVREEKRASLRRMSFSSNEIEFAMDKLGVNVSIDEFVDFIFAARIAENCERDADAPTHNENEMNKDCNPETLFGTMEKTLRLLEMGFSENEISVAIDRHGSDVSIQVLADSIVAYQTYGEDGVPFPSSIKVEEFEYGDFGLPENVKGKRPQEEYINEQGILKKPKQEYHDYSTPTNNQTFTGVRNGNRTPGTARRSPASSSRIQSRASNINIDVKPAFYVPKPRKPLDPTVAKPPYFFYKNVKNLAYDSWEKISQFLYEIEPEFVNTRLFSALDRNEGYVHNLPIENRFHSHPRSPTTIEEALPHVRQWWPLWDTRKHLSGTSSETSTTSQVCDQLGRMLATTRGVPSGEQQRDLLHQCEALNLVWVGQNRVAPIEPEHFERILGYPRHHTRIAGFSITERLLSLENSFQIDTLAYHLSVLKPLFPRGLTLLSINSGVGGAEIALDKLGIHLKGVVSVEPSEMKRKILKQWWEKSQKSGELVQIEGVERLSSTRLESLINKFHGFDLVLCQNPSAESASSKPASDDIVSFDFTSFYEFVRVLQRIRSV